MSTDPTRRERRLRRRHGLEDVRGNLLFSYQCRILNMSATGMAVESAAPLAPGRSYTLKVEHAGRQIPLSGTVAWCRLQGTRRNEAGDSIPLYAAGVELDEDATARGLEVLPLLEKRGVVRLERRLSGHLVPRGAAGEGASPATVVVRSLSRSGLVADAPFFPETGDVLDLWIGLGESGLALTGRVKRVRPASPRDGKPWAELTVEYADLSPADRERLERLIRDELVELAPPDEE